MNPFDAPPSTPAVSFEPPVDPPAPRRGRTVAIVLGTAGVIGAGIVGVSQFAAADDPELTDAASRLELDPVATDDEPADDDSGDEPADGDSDADGEIRIQIGDGDPIVIDLGDLADGDIGRELRECVGVPMLDLPAIAEGGGAPGELGELDLGPLFDRFLADGAIAELFDDEELQRWLDELGAVADDVPWTPGEHAWDPGDQVTVIGDDGVTVIDLGDGDASVTIERDGDSGEVTISTDGTATAQDLDELLGGLDLDEMLGGLDLPPPPEGGWPALDGSELDRLEECVAELEP